MELFYRNIKINKNTAELGYSDLHRVYKSSFAQMPISQENMNLFWSDWITMVPECKYFKFMQIDYPRWPPGAVTEKNINMKMIISQEPLVEFF